MASDLYTRLAETSRRILADKGQAVTLRRQTSTEYDPSTGAPEAGTPAELAMVGALMNFADQARVGIRLRPGTMVREGDRRLLLAPVAGEADPASGDTIVIGAATWSVIDVEPIAPAGVPVLYIAQVRQ